MSGFWMSIVYPAVVVPLLAVDSSLLDSASAGNRARLPRTDDPPISWPQFWFRYFIFCVQYNTDAQLLSISSIFHVGQGEGWSSHPINTPANYFIYFFIEGRSFNSRQHVPMTFQLQINTFFEKRNGIPIWNDENKENNNFRARKNNDPPRIKKKTRKYEMKRNRSCQPPRNSASV